MSVVKTQDRAAAVPDRARVVDLAFEQLPVGVMIVDSQACFVACNKRYVETYGLRAEDLKRGMPLRDVVALRVKSGAHVVDPVQYEAEILATEGGYCGVIALTDGRHISIVNVPLPGGGWVSTHEDITDRIRMDRALTDARSEAVEAAAQARSAHERLLSALASVPEAIVLFDAQDRFVLANPQYQKLFGRSDCPIAAGTPLDEMLRDGLARGLFVDAIGREEEWLKERLALYAQPASVVEQQLSGGRWVQAENYRTPDGGTIGVRIDITDIKRREESFRLLFKGNPIPMFVYDLETFRFLAVNEAAITHYGYSRDEFRARTLFDVRQTADQKSLARLIRETRGTYIGDAPVTHVKADGTTFEVLVYARNLTYEGREAAIAAMIDVTEQKRTEDELRETREFLNRVVDNVPVTIMVKDARDGRYVLMNRAGEEFYGVPRERFIGHTAREVLSPEAASTIEMHDRELLETKSHKLFDEHEFDTPTRGMRLIAAHRLPILDDKGEPRYLIGVIEDITERRLAEAKIEHMAHHDALTDLPNRAAFTAKLAKTLEEAGAHGERFALMCLDLDRFKEVNDVFGHSIGDMLLCEVTRRLRQSAEDDFVARLGGDEFTIICRRGAQPTAAEELAEALIETVADDIEIEGQKLRIGMSIGVAIYPDDGADGSALLANADAALYRAKAESRDTIRFFEPAMDRQLRERRALQNDLRDAVARGELSLHYQPQALINGEIIGFEALVRWAHPQRGEVSPGVFVPLAEESGLIGPIGEWIMREACREAATWRDDLRIAINLSPVQFRQGDIVDLVHTILLETGLSARRLELEITEGVLIGDHARALSILRRLKALGVRIAMDDFGTGYSSLSYLQSFSFDTIKIDRTFISNLEKSPQSVAIVRAVIGLSQGLGVPVIAEGVETDHQLRFLASEKCDEVQGYLIGKPRPIADYAALVGAGKTARAMSRKKARRAAG